MGRILYIFPHPDDESFGPAPAIARQRRDGHEVYLLTLTKGEATSQRAKLGLSKPDMAAVRFAEMQDVARVLDLTGMTVLDFADGELDRLDPLDLEEVVRDHINATTPDVVVTYYTHGISGHRDHLVTHAVVKRVFAELRRAHKPFARRLALFTVPDDVDRPEHLKGTPRDVLDCIIPVDEEDLDVGRRALAAYETYREVVEAHQPMETVRDGVCFVLFLEEHRPVLRDLLSQLEGNPARES